MIGKVNLPSDFQENYDFLGSKWLRERTKDLPWEYRYVGTAPFKPLRLWGLF